MVIYIGS